MFSVIRMILILLFHLGKFFPVRVLSVRRETIELDDIF